MFVHDADMTGVFNVSIVIAVLKCLFKHNLLAFKLTTRCESEHELSNEFSSSIWPRSAVSINDKCPTVRGKNMQIKQPVIKRKIKNFLGWRFT